VNVNILPLAITMVAGPQIMSSIIFLTHQRAVRISLAYVAGALFGVTAGLLAAKGLASLLGENASLGDPGDSGSLGTIIQFGLVGLLIVAAIRNYVKRATIEPPKWLGSLMEADEKRALTLGALLLSIFPSDAVVLLTVGVNLEQDNGSFVDALPFLGLTVFLIALPLLIYLLFRHRAMEQMPKVRDWMNSNSWAINIAVCCIFIALILG
jgi:hypothetical protein